MAFCVYTILNVRERGGEWGAGGKDEFNAVIVFGSSIVPNIVLLSWRRAVNFYSSIKAISVGWVDLGSVRRSWIQVLFRASLYIRMISIGLGSTIAISVG